ILALVAPYVAREFALGPGQLGFVLSFIGIGAVLALAITMLADRFGRRRLLLVTVAGYGVATGLTALAQGPRHLACPGQRHVALRGRAAGQEGDTHPA
nr:hypothetical protein [Thermoanaerobaculia bacterium]